MLGKFLSTFIARAQEELRRFEGRIKALEIGGTSLSARRLALFALPVLLIASVILAYRYWTQRPAYFESILLRSGDEYSITATLVRILSGREVSAGLAGVLATRGRDIELRRGTELEIMLDRPLELPAYR